METPRLEAGSFRDREGRVFCRDGDVYRALSLEAFEQWQAIRTSRFFPRLMETGKVVATEVAEIEPDRLTCSLFFARPRTD